jgi:hypothetical protein
VAATAVPAAAVRKARRSACNAVVVDDDDDDDEGADLGQKAWEEPVRKAIAASKRSEGEFIIIIMEMVFIYIVFN